MLSQEDRQKLADIAALAAANPQDMLKPDPDMLARLSLRIGVVTIGFSHDLMPPGKPYRHLSVSDGGKKPDEALFMEIADAVGMGDKENWCVELNAFFEPLPMAFRARHAFAIVPD